MDSKRCRDCGVEKSLSEFYWSESRGNREYTSYCKPCHAVRSLAAKRRAGHRERLEPEARFWSYVNRTDPGNCWPWTGPVHPYNRTPVMHMGAGGRMAARRYSALLCGWSEQDARNAVSDCGNSQCVNPEHLRIRHPANFTDDGHKFCPHYKMVRPSADFSKDLQQASGVARYCKACAAARQRESAYQLPGEQYEAMLRAQGGKCLICGGHRGKRRLMVDHNHATGTIRGLLCGPCNTGLGMFGDNIAWLRAAVTYLERFGSYSA